MTPSDDDFDLLDLVRRAAAEHGQDDIAVLDFADLGQLPPQLRKAGHMMAQAMSAMDLITSFHEIATHHLASTIALALHHAGGADAGGGVDIEIDTAAQATAEDPELLKLWESARPGARRDLLASLAQLLAVTRRRRRAEESHVAAMIGDHADAGRLWMLAERQLDDAAAAGRDWETEPMLPDAPHLPALASSPVSVAAERATTDAEVNDHHLRLGAAVLLDVATVIETNATGRWKELLRVLEE